MYNLEWWRHGIVWYHFRGKDNHLTKPRSPYVANTHPGMITAEVWNCKHPNCHNNHHLGAFCCHITGDFFGQIIFRCNFSWQAKSRLYSANPFGTIQSESSLVHDLPASVLAGLRISSDCQPLFNEIPDITSDPVNLYRQSWTYLMVFSNPSCIFSCFFCILEFSPECPASVSWWSCWLILPEHSPPPSSSSPFKSHFSDPGITTLARRKHAWVMAAALRYPIVANQHKLPTKRTKVEHMPTSKLLSDIYINSTAQLPAVVKAQKKFWRRHTLSGSFKKYHVNNL